MRLRETSGAAGAAPHAWGRAWGLLKVGPERHYKRSHSDLAGLVRTLQEAEALKGGCNKLHSCTRHTTNNTENTMPCSVARPHVEIPGELLDQLKAEMVKVQGKPK